MQEAKRLMYVDADTIWLLDPVLIMPEYDKMNGAGWSITADYTAECIAELGECRACPCLAARALALPPASARPPARPPACVRPACLEAAC